jgi:hypothetical protein
MVDSLPPSGTDPDSETIITNSNGKLRVPLDGETLGVGSSGKVKAFELTQYYLGSFEDNDSGDWTGFSKVEDGIGTVYVYDKWDLPMSASVTADLTGIDVLNLRMEVYDLKVRIKVDGVELASITDSDGYQTLEISGLDDYDFGTNSTVEIEAYDEYNNNTGNFRIDYIRSNLIQPKSRIIELVDTGGLP